MTVRSVYLFLVVFLFHSQLATAQTIDWMSLEKAQSLAAESGKKVLLYSEAQWCGYCKKMNKEVFPEQSVVDSLHKYFYPVRIDIESKDAVLFNDERFTEQSLARAFRAIRTPTTIFINSDGSLIGTQPGFLPAEIFDKLLAYVGRDYHRRLSFEEYLGNQGITID
ncbi:thioredoxin family protein [Fodinibius sediminis]|uniref:Thioredoxin-related protein n=1 Tax=Fodinibius sediminis TaxID=1214077 RepID=A0A521C681_9BACT|nr:thioredoxin fold domain-containing protein [Fodinibius sediminis]SMO54903.1 Thioredoxin-related protein [Fodinibius sediminis]